MNHPPGCLLLSIHGEFGWLVQTKVFTPQTTKGRCDECCAWGLLVSPARVEAALNSAAAPSHLQNGVNMIPSAGCLPHFPVQVLTGISWSALLPAQGAAACFGLWVLLQRSRHFGLSPISVAESWTPKAAGLLFEWWFCHVNLQNWAENGTQTASLVSSFCLVHLARLQRS